LGNIYSVISSSDTILFVRIEVFSDNGTYMYKIPTMQSSQLPYPT